MSRSPSTQSMLSMRRTADISGSPRVRNMFETEPLGDRVDDLSLSPQRGISLPGGNATAGGNRRVRFEQDFDANSMNSQLCPTRSREQSAEVDDEVILAVAYRSGKVGAAYYSVMTGRLYLMEDMQENNQYELIRLLKFQVCPAIILTSARSEDDFIDALSGADGLSTECEVQARPSTEFAYQNARNKLLSLRLLGQQTFPSDQGEPENTGQRSLGRKTRLSLLAESIVSLNCREMVGCAGALLDYIGKARLTGAIMESGGHRMEVEDIEQFKLDQFMHVNVDCLWSLQIFQDDAHPNMHLYTKGRKEGLSLFGILNNTKTPLGRSLLRLWFLRPSMDIEVIQQRHDAIAFFLRPDVWNVTDQLRLCLRHIKNIPKILRKIRTQASVQEWQCLLKFSYNALKIRSLLSELEEAQRIAVVHKINETFIISILKDVGSCINNVIDFDTSLDEQRFVVKAGVDQDLDELKRTYHGLDSLLSEVAAEISTTIPSEFANQINVIYFPQLGYLITIPLKTGMREQEDFEVEGLYFQFCTASTVYYKSERMFELDETIGDIHSMIVDREIEIMQKLQETILTFSEALDVSAGVTAELDCILSLADAAKKHNYVRPRMTEEPVLEIKQGRHPLHELCADIFIANDTMLGDGEEAPRMMLLTGANFSGKSVYLKQIALITYMAQIGSFVPAESALIGIADKILTRVHTRETVSKMQSTFMTDLNQVGLAIRNSTRRSLVVLDEFGKGTDATDGVSLFCAVLEEFFSRGVECPRLVSATHFHEIFNFELLRAPPTMLKEYTTEIIETHGEQGLTYLYRIKPGRATSSWGVKCAALAGMPEQILQTAQTAADQLARGEKISVPQTAEDKQRDLGAQNVVKFFMTLDCANDSLAPLWELARTVSS
ncbi:muts domain V-domain-containing protein [Gaertneriomyces semiglobifer]|nr:muts domain V-domain-containing protein [Gaertneriomyces semiglobifer]